MIHVERGTIRVIHKRRGHRLCQRECAARLPHCGKQRRAELRARGLQGLIKIGPIGRQQGDHHALNERRNGAKQACDARPLPTHSRDRR